MNLGKHETALKGLNWNQRRRVKKTAKRLMEERGWDEDRAIRQAAEEQQQRTIVPREEESIASPDVSLAHPHGPEGESHGGRGGRDPLRFVEDSTPNGTNAYSRTRGAPSERGRRVRGTARAAKKSTSKKSKGKGKPTKRLDRGRTRFRD